MLEEFGAMEAESIISQLDELVRRVRTREARQ
jgi:hypothetical protein